MTMRGGYTHISRVQAARMAPVIDSTQQFRALFEEQLPFVRRMARFQGVPLADLDDVCQEIFVIIHRRLPDFEGRSSLRGWIYGICWRVCRDWKHRVHLRHEENASHMPERAVPGDHGIRLEEFEALDKLRRLLESLDQDHRMVFLLYEVEKLSMKEVATAVGCPLFTGYSRLRAARAELRRAWHLMNDRGTA